MIISHEHRYIFIKSKKTAGTSLEAALSNYCGNGDVVTPLNDYSFNRDENGRWIHHSMNHGDFRQHEAAAAIREKIDPVIWKDYFKFSIARNPWDRAVSLFNWKARNDPALRPAKRFYHHLGFPFDEPGKTRELFSRFVQGDWETNDRYYIIDDELCVDYVIRYENIAADFSEVCRILGMDTIALPHLKSGFSKGYHYSQYYDNESRAVVSERHKNDIKFFGYRFETA